MKQSIVTSKMDHQEDLQTLAALFRQRQSHLMARLEEWAQRSWETTQWFLRGCDYQEKDSRIARQIRSIIFRWALKGSEPGPNGVSCARGFWIKIKMVVKLSLEKVKQHGMLDEVLFSRYQDIIDAINVGYDRGAGIWHFREVEHMTKQRTQILNDRLGHERTTNRIRPTFSSKEPFRATESPTKTFNQSKSFKNNSLGEGRILSRPLSQQHHKQIRLNSKPFLVGRHLKKINKFIEKYESNLKGTMDGRIEVSLNCKKTIEQNIQQLYSDLMDRNIGNHRIISKFVYRRPLCPLRKQPVKRPLKPLKKPVNIPQTPVQNQAGAKKKGRKVVLPVVRASSAKASRKEGKDQKIHSYQMLEWSGRPRKMRKFV